MNKKLNVEEVEEALKRAARAAVSGSRDERAGRFVVRDADSGRISDRRNDKRKEDRSPKSK
jgi:hypothetical protein